MALERLREKVEEIKKKHGITERQILDRLPMPMSFKRKPTEENVINLLDLIYG